MEMQHLHQHQASPKRETVDDQQPSRAPTQQQSRRHAQLQPYHLATVAPNGEQVQVSLSNSATWRKFNRQNTEMIVTKAGRRMFPCLSLDLSGLDPVKKYELYVTLLLADQNTLKYQRGLWIPNGQGEAYPPPGCNAGLVYVHPDSPATGRQWSKQEVTFMKLKLTNKLDGFEDPNRNGSMIFAYSMHKYLPVVHISEVPSGNVKPELAGVTAPTDNRFYTSVAFPGTEFITVTAYQNPELTDLKIQFNPYAKGVRNQTDRSSSLLIDTFRPAMQAMAQREQQREQSQQHHVQQHQAHLHQQHQQSSASTSDIQFGAYPNQTASAYGHWQTPSATAAAAANRRHQPYGAVSSAASAGPSASAASSVATIDSRQHRRDSHTPPSPSHAVEDPTSTPAVSTSAVEAAVPYYPSSQYFYQQHQHQHDQHMYYPSYYYPQPANHHELQSSADYYQQQQQHHLQLGFVAPQTPPQQVMQHSSLLSVPPQSHGCSSSLLLQASNNSQVTDSSPSGLSFNSPCDL